MNKSSVKTIQTLSFLLTLLVVLSSIYLQYFLHLNPCPLCIMQRICAFLLLATFGISIWQQRHFMISWYFQLFFSVAGAFFAIRQLWLQHLPADQLPACMPGLDILVKYFPWHMAAKSLLWGTGDCGEVDWSFLNLSLAAWSALYFLFMIGITLSIRGYRNSFKNYNYD